MENEAIQNTAGEAGQTSQNDFNYDAFLDNIANAVSKRTSKVETSIVNDNLSKLPENERDAALNYWNERKQKEANKAVEAQKKLQKDYETTLNELNSLKATMKTEKISSEAKSILSKNGVSNSKSAEYALKLAGDLNQFYKEDGSIDSENMEAVITAILNDVPGLKSEQKQIVYQKPQADIDAQASNLEEAAIDAAFGINK